MLPCLYPVTFRYLGPVSGSVVVVGSFNHWNPSAHPLLCCDGEWRITIYLPPGMYPYAFVTGGELVRDPDPQRTLRGPLGTLYSVLTVPGEPSPARAA
jgi:1,4-alpha-glucan branching enzyme